MAADYTFDGDTEAEADAAADYYEGKRSGLGASFTREFRACIDRVRVSPRGHSAWHGHFRRANFQRFPYYVVYSFDGTTVVVHAVYHSARDPDPLKARLGDP